MTSHVDSAVAADARARPGSGCMLANLRAEVDDLRPRRLRHGGVDILDEHGVVLGESEAELAAFGQRTGQVGVDGPLDG